MMTILPVYTTYKFFNCELCDIRVGDPDGKNKLFQHYNTFHKRQNELALKNITDIEMRKALNFDPIECNLQMCEVCNEQIYEDKLYLTHLIEYHNANEILAHVKNDKIREVLSNRGLLSIQCELCNDRITEDVSREGYIKHIKAKHMDELNYEILTKILDTIVVRDCMLLVPQEKKTKIELEKPPVSNFIQGNEYFEEIYKKVQEEEKEVKTIKCDVFSHECVNLTPYMEDYLHHFLTEHYFWPCGKNYKQVLDLFTRAGYVDFRCEVCDVYIGDFSLDYYRHIVKYHKENYKDIIFFVKDLLVLTWSWREIMMDEKINKPYTNTVLRLPSHNRNELGIGNALLDSTALSSKDNFESQFSTSYQSSEQKDLNTILKEKQEEIDNIKSMNDSIFDERIEELEKEMHELFPSVFKEIKKESNVNENIISCDMKPIPKSSNEYRVISCLFKEMTETAEVINLYSLSNMNHATKFDSKKNEDFKEDFFLYGYNKEIILKENNSFIDLVPSSEKGFMFTKSISKFLPKNNKFSEYEDNLILSLVLKDKHEILIREGLFLADPSLMLPLYLVNYSCKL